MKTICITMIVLSIAVFVAYQPPIANFFIALFTMPLIYIVAKYDEEKNEEQIICMTVIFSLSFLANILAFIL